MSTPIGQTQRDVDAAVAVGDREPLGERDGGVLGHRVRRDADLGQQAGGGRRDDEAAAAPLEPAGHEQPRRDDVGAHVDVDRAVPGLVRRRARPRPTAMPALAKNASTGPNAALGARRAAPRSASRS